jgi:hypothetical protein
MLSRLLAAQGGGPATVGAVVDHFAERGLAAALALLALPIALPVPMPGISAVFGLPIGLIALQLALRRRRLWLPAAIRRRPLDPARLQVAGAIAVRWLTRLERVLRPRLVLLCHPWMQSLYGLICAWLALILFLPVPFGNVLPSLSVFALAVAVLERDGLAALAGLALSAVSIVLTAGTMAAAAFASWAVLRRLVGM